MKSSESYRETGLFAKEPFTPDTFALIFMQRLASNCLLNLFTFLTRTHCVRMPKYVSARDLTSAETKSITFLRKSEDFFKGL